LRQERVETEKVQKKNWKIEESQTSWGKYEYLIEVKLLLADSKIW
jgi:hypothetical protein